MQDQRLQNLIPAGEPIESFRPQYSNSLQQAADPFRQQSETVRRQKDTAHEQESVTKETVRQKTEQAVKSQQIANEKLADSKQAQKKYLNASEELAKRQNEANESAKRLNQAKEQHNQHETDAAKAAQHFQTTQKNESDARKKLDDHLDRIKSATPAEKLEMEKESKHLKDQHQTAKEASNVAKTQTDAAQVKAKLSAEMLKKSAAEHNKAFEAVKNATGEKDRTGKKAEDAVRDHVTASEVAKTHRDDATAAHTHLDAASKESKKDSVAANHDASRQNAQVSNGPITDFAAFAHQKAVESKSSPERKSTNALETKATNASVHPILSNPAWSHYKQHVQQQISQAKWPIHVPGKTAFQSVQKNALAKLNPVDKAAVFAGIAHHRAKVFATLKHVDHKSNPGRIDLGTHKAHLPANRPGKGQSGKGLAGLTSGHHALASLGAANAASFGNGTSFLTGTLAGLVIGSIGQAMLLGPGAFGPGGFSSGGVGYGAGDDGSALFNSGCTYVPNGDDSQVDPNADGSGVVMSANSDPNGDSSVDPQQGTGFDQQISSSPDGSSDNSDVSQTVVDDGSNVPIDSVPQTGRYLNVVNLSQSRATFHVKYHAVDQAGNWKWYPSSPDAGDDALIFDLDPGQAVELWDGDWHVYADKARIWASSADGQHQWARYQNNDLLLVSEQDDQGQPSYLSPEIQTLSFGLK